MVSKQRDFAESLAELLQQALSINCRIASDAGDVGDALLVISEEPVEAGCPVYLLPQKPFLLSQVLPEIADMLQRQPERLALPRGYQLQPRHKLLLHQPSGRSADVTDTEMRLLQCFAGAGREGVGREQLLRQVWGIEAALDTHTLETHIYRLRGKFRELAGDEGIIAAVEGGYALVDGNGN